MSGYEALAIAVGAALGYAVIAAGFRKTSAAVPNTPPANCEPAYTVQIVAWDNAQENLRAIRSTVFIEEQHVPQELEWDGEDEHAIHALARDPQGQAIGTARLIVHGALAHVGRMAVLEGWRGLGVGSALLQLVLAEARQQGATSVFLNAQTYAVPFYERAGFVREGDEFMDAEIPHYRMRRQA